MSYLHIMTLTMIPSCLKRQSLIAALALDTSKVFLATVIACFIAFSNNDRN